jgi:hypothetical protein
MRVGFLIKCRPCITSITATKIEDKDTICPLQNYVIVRCNVWLVHCEVDNSTSGYNMIEVIFARLGRYVVVRCVRHGYSTCGSWYDLNAVKNDWRGRC